MSYSQAELAHYGIKGMKWGVRQTDPKTGKKTLTKGAKIAAGIGVGASAALIAAGAAFMSRPGHAKAFQEILYGSIASRGSRGGGASHLAKNIMNRDVYRDFNVAATGWN